jgi:hypothetical protein
MIAAARQRIVREPAVEGILDLLVTQMGGHDDFTEARSGVRGGVGRS